MSTSTPVIERPAPPSLAPPRPAVDPRDGPGAHLVIGPPPGPPAIQARGAAVPGALRVLTQTFTVGTTEHVQFVDVTDHVAECVAAAGITDGSVLVFSRHTTACVRINEAEPLLLEDLRALLERVVPQDAAYRHDDFTVRTVHLHENERVNGHSHCRSLLLGASETVPVAAGTLLLGRWQRVFFTELDGPAARELVIQVMGT